MARWGLLLLVLLSWGLIGFGTIDRLRMMFPRHLWGADLNASVTQLELVELTGNIESSGALFNRSPLSYPLDTPRYLSDESPRAGSPLNGPDGVPRDRWMNLVGEQVVWDGPLKEGVYLSEQISEISPNTADAHKLTTQRMVGEIAGEESIRVVSPIFQFEEETSPQFIQFNDETYKSITRWCEQKQVVGRLHTARDFQPQPPYPENMAALPGTGTDEAWLIETEGDGWSMFDDQGMYAYVPLEGKEVYVQIPMVHFYDGEPNLVGILVPPGQHGFTPLDPRTKEPLSTSSSLLVTGASDVTLLLNEEWRQRTSWIVLVSGMGLLGGLSLVLLAGLALGWKVSPAVPEALKPYAPHIVSDSPPWWVISRSLGILLIVVGIFGSIAGFAAINGHSSEPSPFVFALAFLGLPIGWALVGVGFQLCQRNVAAAMRRSDRPPILYLRSFAADSRWIEHPIDLLWMFLFPGRFETSERSLTKSLSGVGSLIAIGQPGEMLPPMGAARLYVKHDKWQEVVAYLSKISGLIMLRVGSTDSFWWEVEHVLESCPPEKVLFMLPRGNEFRTYDVLARHLAPRLKQLFPQPTLDMRFVGFRDDWSPVLLGNKQVTLRSRFRKLLIGSTAPMVRDILLPALRQAGYKAGRLPLQFREWLLVLLLVGFLTSIMVMIGWFIHLDSLRNRAGIFQGPPPTIAQGIIHAHRRTQGSETGRISSRHAARRRGGIDSRGAYRAD